MAQYPSAAQQMGNASTTHGDLNVTLQQCDLTRPDQRFVPVAPGSKKIALAGTTLCLAAKAGMLHAVPCQAAPAQFSLAPDEQLKVVEVDGQCLSSRQGSATSPPAFEPCVYSGPMPPPLSVGSNYAFGLQVFIWGGATNQIVTGGDGTCLTVGLPNIVPGQGWVTNNGTLEHEVWMGDLTTSAAGKLRRVVALFNKGGSAESLTAPAEVIGTATAAGATAVRDAVAQKDLAPLPAGASLSSVVARHGVNVYILELP